MDNADRIFLSCIFMFIVTLLVLGIIFIREDQKTQRLAIENGYVKAGKYIKIIK